MARGDVDIKITAKDTASTILNRVADNAEQLEKLDPKIIIEASDKASDNLDKVMARTKALDDETVSVILTAEAAKAEAEIKGIQKALGSLDGEVATAAIVAKDQASARLDKIQSELRALDKTTVTPKVDVRGAEKLSSAIGSLPGPLGQVSGAVDGIAGGLGGMVPVVGALSAGLLAMASSAADTAIAVRNLSFLTGESVEDTSKLEQVWSSTGADVNDLADVINQVNGVLGDSPDLVRELGIALEGASPQEVFIQAAEAVGRMNDAQKRSVLGAKVFGEEGVRQVAGVLSQYDDLSQAVEDMPALISEDDIDRAEEFNTRMTEVNRSLQDTKLRVLENTAAFAELFTDPSVGGWLDSLAPLANVNNLLSVNKDKTEDVTEAEKQQRYAADAAARTNAIYAGSTRDVSQATLDAARHAEEAARMQQGLADAYKRVEDAVKAAQDAQKSYADASFALLDAQEGMADALAHTAEVRAQETSETFTAAQKHEALEDAYRAERQQAIAAADAAKRVAEEQAKANGKTATAEDLLKAQNDELFKQAYTASPAARNEIAKYIAQVNGIPPEKITAIFADTDPNNLAQVQREIAAATADQTVGVKLDFLNVNDFQNQVRRALGGVASATPQMATTNVTVHMPRGVRGDDVVTAINRHAKRNGRRR